MAWLEVEALASAFPAKAQLPAVPWTGQDPHVPMGGGEHCW